MRNVVAGGAGLGVAANTTMAAADESAKPLDKVPRRKLGKSGLEVPVILMGCCQQLDPKYDKRLHRAYQLGVDHLDSAQMYAEGQSHATIVPFIEQVGGRDKLQIASKWHCDDKTATPEQYAAGLDQCLEELKTDYLDIFYLHFIRDPRLLEPEFIKMGQAAKKAGKTKLFGISCHHGNVPELMQKAAKIGTAGIDVVMFRYNFRQYGDLELNKAIDACVDAGIGLLAIKTLAAIPDDAEEIVPWTSKDFTLPQAKIRAVLEDERIAALASQMANVEQVMENTAAVLSPKSLAMRDFVQLNRLAALTADQYCAACTRCEECIDADVPVADIFRHLMYSESYGEHETARKFYAALTAEQRRIEGIDFQRASAGCPQGIDIAARLQKAREVLST